MKEQKNKELLKPKTDVVFHSLFRVGNEGITKSIISDIIQEKIETIDLDNDRYLIKEIPQEKLGILDLKAKLDKGAICNIEVQLSDKGNTVERFVWYWSKLFSEQLKESQNYSELKKCICILILNYELKDVKGLKNILDCHTKWKIIESRQRKIILTDVLEIHIIEIPKAIKMSKIDSTNKIVQWMMFLDNPNCEEVSMIMNENEGITKAMEKLKEISEDEKLRRIAQLREKAIRDERSAISFATNKGLEEGMKEGIKEGEKNKQIEIAKKMLEMNINIDIIQEVTGITQEEIKNIEK